MTKRRRAIHLTACVAILLAWSATSASAGQTYYVSADGNDAADGTSKKTPWRTLDRVAMHTFAAGDRLLLAGGDVHHGSIQLGPDRSAGNIEIGSYGKGRAIIDAGTGPGIVIENLSDVKISSLEIRGSGQETNTADGILIVTHVDPFPENTTPLLELQDRRRRGPRLQEIRDPPPLALGDRPAQRARDPRGEP